MKTPPPPSNEDSQPEADEPAPSATVDLSQIVIDSPMMVIGDEESGELDFLNTPYLHELAQLDPDKAAFARRWRPVFIETLSKTPGVTVACTKARVALNTVKSHRTKDPVFAAAWAYAVLILTDRLQQACFNDAVYGHDEPVSIGGKIIYVRKYSEQMRAMMLKGLLPDVFDRAQHLEISGTLAVGHSVATPEQLAAAAANALPWIQAARAKYLGPPRAGDSVSGPLKQLPAQAEAAGA